MHEDFINELRDEHKVIIQLFEDCKDLGTFAAYLYIRINNEEEIFYKEIR